MCMWRRAWCMAQVKAMEGETREENAEPERNEADESTQPEDEESEAVVVVEEIQRLIESVVQFGEYRRTQRKESYNLARRFKLLLPLMEDLRDLPHDVPQNGVVWLKNLRDALFCARDLLRLCSQGSKIHLVINFHPLSYTTTFLPFFFFCFLNKRLVFC